MWMDYLTEAQHSSPGWCGSAGTYSFSCSCSCSALSSPFRLFKAPWRCSWSSDGSTLGWSSLDWSPFGCFCTETLDGERTKGFGLPSSEADCFGLSEELTFWRQWKHLLTFPLLAGSRAAHLWCMGEASRWGPSQQGRCSGNILFLAAETQSGRVLARPRGRTESELPTLPQRLPGR